MVYHLKMALLIFFVLGNIGFWNAAAQAQTLFEQAPELPLMEPAEAIELEPLSYDPNEPRLDRLLRRLAEIDASDPARITALVTDIKIELTRHDSPTAELLFERAKRAKQVGNLKQAMDHLTRLIAFYPDFPEAWHLRANLYFEQGALLFALRDFEQTLALEQRNFTAWQGLGTVLEDLGQQVEAAAAYRSALAWNPHFAAAQSHLLKLEEVLKGQAL